MRTEAEFDAALRAAQQTRQEPLLDRATHLGARAERLAWVFAAGYQSAVAACFPEFDGPGLSCLAATTREGSEPTRLSRDGSGWRLDGEKTWVAAADHVARLVVTVDGPDGPAFANVVSDAAGVALTNPGPASFLAELSQGAARFEHVILAEDALLSGPERARRFRGAEPLYVCAALAGRLECDAAIDLARTVEATLDDRDATKAGLATLRETLRAAFVAYEAERLGETSEGLRSSFATDRRLLKMFIGLE